MPQQTPILLAANKDVFLSSTGNLSDKYQMSFTPAGFTFSIWGIIYFWLAATMVLCECSSQIDKIVIIQVDNSNYVRSVDH